MVPWVHALQFNKGLSPVDTVWNHPQGPDKFLPIEIESVIVVTLH